MRTIATAIAGLAVILALAVSGPLSRSATAQSTHEYQYQDWIVNYGADSAGQSTLTLALNGITNAGWDVFSVSPTTDPAGTLRYVIVARRIIGTSVVPISAPSSTPAPVATTITCPGSHGACAILPAGSYDRAWADAVIGR